MLKKHCVKDLYHYPIRCFTTLCVEFLSILRKIRKMRVNTSILHRFRLFSWRDNRTLNSLFDDRKQFSKIWHQLPVIHRISADNTVFHVRVPNFCWNYQKWAKVPGNGPFTREQFVKYKFLTVNWLRAAELCRNSRPEVFCEKGVLENFAIFTGKHLGWSFYLIKLQV